MGLLSLSYRRPEYVLKTEEMRPSSSATTKSTDSNNSAASDENAAASVKSGPSGISRGIPSALSFDKIIEGGTCPPCTIRDFMNYLIYVERAAENLQFFLWLRDYKTRFEAASTADLSLSPEWTQAKEDEVTGKLQKEHTEKMRKEPEVVTRMFKGTDFDKDAGSAAERNDADWGSSSQVGGDGESTIIGSQSTNYKAQADEAFSAAGAKQPFTIQPFREEIDRVIATYIVEDSPRQLNLASRERVVLVHALAFTTHPSAFQTVAQTVEHSLRRQAHPNFIRWSICNGNPARVFFARALGVSLIVLGLLASVIMALSSTRRGYRALGAIGWMLGVSTLVAAYKGMCVVLHGMHHRHVRPWELFETDERDVEIDGSEGRMSKGSFDSFGSSNSYEDEPWVVKYEKRNIIRKIFDREVWIQEPALRQIQDTIFLQAILAALFASGLLVLIFVLVPGGDLF